jgi:hypothetical protein
MTFQKVNEKSYNMTKIVNYTESLSNSMDSHENISDFHADTLKSGDDYLLDETRDSTENLERADTEADRVDKVRDST